MKPIYDINGEIIDFGDEGQQVREIENEVDIFYLLKRLSPRQRKIVKLKMAGFNLEEIAIKLKLSIRTIKREMALLRERLSIMDNRE